MDGLSRPATRPQVAVTGAWHGLLSTSCPPTPWLAQWLLVLLLGARRCGPPALLCAPKPPKPSAPPSGQTPPASADRIRGNVAYSVVKGAQHEQAKGPP